MQNYTRLSVVSIAEVLPLITSSNKTIKKLVAGEMVKVSSLRLQTFAKSTECSSCGLKASHFAVEAGHGQVSYHLNLYGEKNGEEILFTHDHTLARSLGGKDNISNTTTMCSPCNFEKSKGERDKAEELRKNRKKEE